MSTFLWLLNEYDLQVKKLRSTTLLLCYSECLTSSKVLNPFVPHCKQSIKIDFADAIILHSDRQIKCKKAVIGMLRAAFTAVFLVPTLLVTSHSVNTCKTSKRKTTSRSKALFIHRSRNFVLQYLAFKDVSFYDNHLRKLASRYCKYFSANG